MATEKGTSSQPTPDTVPGAATVDPPIDTVAMLRLLDQMEALIPEYAQPDPLRLGIVRGNARFASDLIQPAITAFKSYEPFQKRSLFDVNAGLSALTYRDRLRPVTQRLAAITVAMSYSIDQKLASSATEALQMYAWAKRHAKKPDGGGAQTYVDEMKRVVARTINRRKQKQPATTTPPPTAPPAQGFLAGSLANAGNRVDDGDLPALVHEEAAKKVNE